MNDLQGSYPCGQSVEVQETMRTIGRRADRLETHNINSYFDSDARSPYACEDEGLRHIERVQTFQLNVTFCYIGRSARAYCMGSNLTLYP